MIRFIRRLFSSNTIRITLAMLVIIALSSVVQMVLLGYGAYLLGYRIYDGSPTTLQAHFRDILHEVEQAFRPNSAPQTILNTPFRPLERIDQYILLGSPLVTLLVTVFLAYMLSRRIAKPMRAISKTTHKISSGDLSARASISRSHDRGETETARLMRDFNAMADTLDRLETERKATMASIAHELRTPITILRGRLEAIRDGIFPLNDLEMGRLIGQTLLLSRLVDDLRTLSLADAGKLELYKINLELSVWLQELWHEYQPRAQAKNLELKWGTLETLQFRADPDRMHQVVGNLLENALRYAPENGWVQISLERQENHALLRICDSGEGLPPQDLAKVFDRFYRSDQARSRVSGGSGLGLSIVRAVVELHGGTVEARNLEGGGADFWLRFPLEEEISQIVLPKPRGWWKRGQK
jgi:two-component system, OmpR family, sensor histidine kinase BaeS